MIGVGLSYVLLIVGMIASNFFYTTPAKIIEVISSPQVQYSTSLSLISCTCAAILSVWLAIPVGYIMSRYQFRGQAFIEAVLDIPIVLPPLCVGISLLILFQTPAGLMLDRAVASFMSAIGVGNISGISYEIPAVILAQFTVSAAFAIRTMRITFEQIDPRAEQVALTLGCNQRQAFSHVALPQSWRGIIASFTLSWARSLGEFGPILIFAGTTPFKTEVLSSTVYLAFNRADLKAAVAASIVMISLSVVVLLLTRLLGISREVTR
jgi:molybdate transport system permease protein